MKLTALHDGSQIGFVLKYLDVRQRVAFDEQQIGQVTGLDHPDAKPHQFAALARGGNERLQGREAEKLDKELQVARVATDRITGKSVPPGAQAPRRHAAVALGGVPARQ